MPKTLGTQCDPALRAANATADTAGSVDLLDAAGVSLAEVRPDGRFFRVNAHLCTMSGYSRETLLTLSIASVLPAQEWPPRPSIARSPSRAPVTLGSQNLRRSDGTTVWVEISAARTNPSTSDGSYLITIIDLARYRALETKLAESELRRVRLERSARGGPIALDLSHRLRNVYPIVLLIVKMTAGRYPAAADYCHALEQRLRALAAAEDLMQRAHTDSVTLDSLLQTELQPFQDIAEVVIDGPTVALSGAMAQCFVILLHELTTNAAKYGALGVSGGQLMVRWQIEVNADQTRSVAFEWLERRGPPVSEPHRHGFGTVVIGQSGDLLGGSAQIDYAAEGLCYRLRFPLDRSQTEHTSQASPDLTGRS